MTAINRCIKEAKQGAKVIRIRSKDVRGMAEHFRMLSHKPVDIEDVVSAIKRGELKILDVPVSVED